MHIIDADREAAKALRAILADICGFWHKPGDDSPLCLARARHRVEAEQRTAEKLAPIALTMAAPRKAFEIDRPDPRPRRPRRLAAQQLGETPPD